jgi:hypothetical protein
MDLALVTELALYLALFALAVALEQLEDRP